MQEVHRESPQRAGKKPVWPSALSAKILVTYPLLIGTSVIVSDSFDSSLEFSSLVTFGGLPRFWRRMRDLNPR